jgi:hypothetical protein
LNKKKGRKASDHVEDGSKSNTIFANFPEIHQYIYMRKNQEMAYDSSIAFDDSWIDGALPSLPSLRMASLKP